MGVLPLQLFGVTEEITPAHTDDFILVIPQFERLAVTSRQFVAAEWLVSKPVDGGSQFVQAFDAGSLLVAGCFIERGHREIRNALKENG